MSNPFSEILISQKAGTVTASSAILTWVASLWGWIDANLTMLQISSFTSFLLAVVMIVAHFCDTMRKNREHRILVRKSELELEILRAQVERLSHQEEN
jgi:hypothetical protein